jgi:hypothetical protein
MRILDSRVFGSNSVSTKVATDVCGANQAMQWQARAVSSDLRFLSQLFRLTRGIYARRCTAGQATSRFGRDAVSSLSQVPAKLAGRLVHDGRPGFLGRIKPPGSTLIGKSVPKTRRAERDLKGRDPNDRGTNVRAWLLPVGRVCQAG